MTATDGAPRTHGSAAPTSVWPRVAAALVAMTGLGSAALVAANASMTASETVRMVAWAVGTALVGGVAVAVVLRACRSRSLAAQVAILTSGTALVVVIGAWLGARAMFFSEHDLSVLVVLLVAAGSMSVVVALLLGDRLARDSAALVDAARQLGDGEVVVATRPTSGELARLAQELEVTSARLDEARRREHLLEQSHRELVAWVSHDLRTPLAGIRAISEALEDGIPPDDETRARYYATLGAEAQRLSVLVDDLFELSRARAGVVQLDLERLSLTDLVSDAIAGVTAVADAKGVRVSGEIGEPPTELTGSAPELLRALRNILENAVRHTPADGSVAVWAGRVGDEAVVSVSDDGEGISADDIDRIFDVGYRGDKARTPGEGAGLGLAIARSFVEAHKGRITVTSQPTGACFTVRLPIDQGPVDQQPVETG